MARRKTVSLREDFVGGQKPIVDEAKCIICGLKLCGLESENGRSYTPDCLKEAASLYEGKPCYANHLKVGETRAVEDDLGVWRNVTFREGHGLYGDLHYDPSTAGQVLSRAKLRPENLGFSHDADTDPKFVVVKEGKSVITKITRVNSVDFVAQPATTSGLTEGKEMDEPSDPKAMLAQAVAAMLQSDDAETHALAQKVSKLLKPEVAEPVAEDDSEPEKKDDEKKQEACKEDDDEKDKKMESRIAELEASNKRLTEEKTVLKECKSAGFTPSDEQLSDLVECTGDKRKRLLAAYKAATPDDKKTRSRGTPIPVRESVTSHEQTLTEYRLVG